MNYELDYFDHILFMINNGIAISTEEIDIESEMKGELIRIKQRIDAYVPLHSTPLEAYIHYHLSCFDRFKRKVNQMSVSTLNQKFKETLNKLELAMDDLIDHIYHYFPNEFDPYTIATAQQVQSYHNQYGIKETELLKSIQAHSINPQLKLILETLLDNNHIEQATFFEIAFRKTLLDTLIPFLNLTDPDAPIAMLLVSLRYNDHKLYGYLLESIHQKQITAISSADQFRELILFKKAIAQLMEIREREYYSQNPNIKTMLIQAIDEEINFLKEVDFLNSELVHSGILDSTYKVGLSVRQLAFYIFLNVECGVITERKAKTVHQYIVAHVSTKEAEQISEKSFSNGYYVHHPEDIRKVSEFLAKMLAMAQKLY